MILGSALMASWAWIAADMRSTLLAEPPITPRSPPETISGPSQTGAKTPASSLGTARLTSDAVNGTTVESLARYAERVIALSSGEFEREFLDLWVARKGRIVFDGLRRPGGLQLDRSDPYLQVLLTRWGEINPSAAFASLDALQEPGLATLDRDNLRNLVLEGWVVRDPASAFKWAADTASRLPPDALSSAMPARFSTLVATLMNLEKPGIAGAMLGQFGTAEAQQVLTIPFVSRWAAFDTTAAARWTMTLPPGSPARANALSSLARLSAKSDPSMAFELLRGLEGRELDMAGRGAVLAFSAQGDYAGALNFLNKGLAANLPGNRMDTPIAHYFSNSAFDSNPEPLRDAALLEQIANPQNRSNAAMGFARRAEKIFPSVAIETIARHVEPATRDARVASLVISWSKRSPAEAAAFLRDSTVLDTTLKVQLMEATAGPRK